MHRNLSRLIWRRKHSLVILTIAICLSGCGSDGPRKYPVSGTVTFEGKPIEIGEIHFCDIDGETAADGGQIRNGEYHFKAKPGPKRVIINAARATGEMQPVPPGETGEPIPIVKGYLPAAYNHDSHLEATVTESSKSNQFNFDLNEKGT